MNPMFKAMQPKKKRPVDPNAPPRPNLLSHDKTLRETKTTIEQLQQENQELRVRLSNLESKVRAQSDYMSMLHQYISRKK
jgi:predicted RNase H-like nuclease (RuvC/YqgF family)